MSGVKRDCICPRAHHEHGTNNAYVNDRCRCDECRAAAAAIYRKRYRLRTYGRWQPFVDSIGTARRLQALATGGWDCYTLADRLGLKRQYVHVLRQHKARKVTPATAAKVSAIYDELWDVPRAAGQANRTRNYARRNGWAPPLAWDDDTIDDPTATPATPAPVAVLDEIAVERYIAGTLHHPGHCSHSDELVEAVRRMAPNCSDAEIGRRVGISGEAVTKLRERNQIPSPRTVTRRETAA